MYYNRVVLIQRKEESPLQALDIFGSIIFGFPPIVIGTFFGYIIGSRERMIYFYRLLLGAIISVGGGYAFSQLIPYFVSITAELDSIILSIMGFAGGVVLGAILNWKPLIYVKDTTHVIYELDNDDQFDKEIEKALHGKSDQHNH